MNLGYLKCDSVFFFEIIFLNYVLKVVKYEPLSKIRGPSEFVETRLTATIVSVVYSTIKIDPNKFNEY